MGRVEWCSAGSAKFLQCLPLARLTCEGSRDSRGPFNHQIYEAKEA